MGCTAIPGFVLNRNYCFRRYNFVHCYYNAYAKNNTILRHRHGSITNGLAVLLTKYKSRVDNNRKIIIIFIAGIIVSPIYSQTASGKLGGNYWRCCQMSGGGGVTWTDEDHGKSLRFGFKPAQTSQLNRHNFRLSFLNFFLLIRIVFIIITDNTDHIRCLNSIYIYIDGTVEISHCERTTRFRYVLSTALSNRSRFKIVYGKNSRNYFTVPYVFSVSEIYWFFQQCLVFYFYLFTVY